MTTTHSAHAAEPPRALVIIGHPVRQSLSPTFQNAALRAAGLAVEYSRRDVVASDLASVFAEFERARIGGNVTMPHKEAVRALAAHLTPEALRTGAVNTFWFDHGALVGHNTDIDGARATIHALCPHGVAGDIVLLGAGGAAAAVLVAIEEMPVLRDTRVRIVARTPSRAETLVRQVASRGTVHTTVGDIDWSQVGLVVNATPSGMRDDDDVPIAVERLASHTAVFDLVYRQPGTAWVRAAKARGLVAEDGLRMLVEQGAAAFACWFGRSPSRAAMWEALGVSPPDAPAARA